jgi:hypothetical protein
MQLKQVREVVIYIPRKKEEEEGERQEILL